MFFLVHLRATITTMTSLPWVTLALAVLLTHTSSLEELTWTKEMLAGTKSHLPTLAAVEKETAGKIDQSLSTPDGEHLMTAMKTASVKQEGRGIGVLITPMAVEAEKNSSLTAISEDERNGDSLQTDEGEAGGKGGGRGVTEGVGVLFRDIIVNNRLDTCHLLVITEGQKSRAFSAIIM